MRTIALSLAALGLTACQQHELPTRTPLTSIEGRLAAVTPLPDTVGYGNVDGWPAERAVVRPDGSFTLSLPTDVRSDPVTWADPSCESMLTVSDSGVKYREVTSLVAFRGENDTAIEVRSTAPNFYQGHVYVYATRSVRIHGEEVCGGQDFRSYDLTFHPGWNVKKFTVYRDATGVHERHESVPPSALLWKSRVTP